MAAAFVFGVFSSSATSSHAAMNRVRIKRAFSLGEDGCKAIKAKSLSGITPDF
jgi:hypothetical protein